MNDEWNKIDREVIDIIYKRPDQVLDGLRQFAVAAAEQRYKAARNLDGRPDHRAQRWHSIQHLEGTIQNLVLKLHELNSISQILSGEVKSRST